MNKKNSGFSLVELIVVIAIMAVLVGVLAPAYLKYVEKSRKSADISAISDIMDAASKILVDVQYEDDISTQTRFNINYTTGKVAVAVTTVGADNDAVKSAWASDAGLKNMEYSIKSKNWKGISAENAQTATGTPDANGNITWTASAKNASSTTDFWAATRGYSSDFNKKFS